ncbi:hypothetical protein THASP1DRAFT_31264 [Thamnocephalis sphaerospora]|uniref:Uncharacterized protein n=1 Tax=Thamnocephalis sphaerospora TaxID=78915 RepID=A0A4P9XNE4_9FUNG|nr:hypothetical protein THASP1DRAFT_31264 [Thamnocephalis sphaerospora]|eukprot:RKP06921.1 hypothetical protein THASP1DRAFT_31264 [Thamnocephalis sphaerospora]
MRHDIAPKVFSDEGVDVGWLAKNVPAFWYHALLQRRRAAHNWFYKQGDLRREQMPRPLNNASYRMLGSSLCGTVMAKDNDCIYVIGATVDVGSCWYALRLDPPSGWDYCPLSAVVSHCFVVVCSEMRRKKYQYGEGLLGDQKQTEKKVTAAANAPSWKSCVQAWLGGDLAPSLELHSPYKLRQVQISHDWLLMQVGDAPAGDHPERPHTTYRVLNLRRRVWCSGVLVASAGLCHVHSAKDDTVAVFTLMLDSVNRPHWRLTELHCSQPPRVRASGSGPLWPWSVLSGTSALVGVDTVILHVKFATGIAQDCAGLLDLPSNTIRWQGCGGKDTVLPFPGDRNLCLVVRGRRAEVWPIAAMSRVYQRQSHDTFTSQHILGTIGLFSNSATGACHVARLNDDLGRLEIRSLRRANVGPEPRVVATQDKLITVGTRTGQLLIRSFLS